MPLPAHPVVPGPHAAAPTAPKAPTLPDAPALPAGSLLQHLVTARAKSTTGTTVLEHASHALQVAQWLTGATGMGAAARNRVCLAAALHDVGKAVTAPGTKRWVHAPQSAALVPDLLADPACRAMLQAAGLSVDLTSDEIAEVAQMCREHHGFTAKTIMQNPGAPFVAVADAIASALDAGERGCVAEMLSTGYHGLTLALLRTLGRAPWADTEIHSLEFPRDPIADLLLAETVVERLVSRVRGVGLTVVMRSAGRLWLAGPYEALERLLDETIATEDVLPREALRGLYERGQVPRAPQAEPPMLDLLFASDAVACLYLKDLLTRRAADTRAVFERQGLAFHRLIEGVDAATLADPVALGSLIYAAVRAWFVKHHKPAAKALPVDHRAWIAAGPGTCDQTVKALAAAVATRKPALKADAEELKKLIMRGTACRSVSNAVRERLAVVEELESRTVAFRLREVAWVDGLPPAPAGPPVAGRGAAPPKGKRMHRRAPSRADRDALAAGRAEAVTPTALCAQCGLRPATVKVSALLAGATQGDSRWASAGQRRDLKVCAWCHSAGVVTLPLATLRVLGGARKVRDLNYILVESPFSRDRLAAILTELGMLDAAGAHAAVAEAPPEAPLSAEDVALFEAIQGAVPAPMAALGIAGLRGSLPVRAALGRILPGDTPLASRAVFILPGAALFGQHETSETNSVALQMLVHGLVATLATHLGPSRFSVRVASDRGEVLGDDATLTGPVLQRAHAQLALAEFRRRHLANPAIHQAPHELDLDFVLALAERPRPAVSRLVREIMKTTPPLDGAAAKIDAVVSLADQLTRHDPDPVAGLLEATLLDLMDLGVVREIATPFSHRTDARGRRRFKSNIEVCGALQGFWEVTDERSLDAWAGRVVRFAHTRRQSRRVGPADIAPRVRHVVDRIRAFAAAQDLPIGDLARRICDQNYLAVFSASRLRRQRRTGVRVVDLQPQQVVAHAGPAEPLAVATLGPTGADGAPDPLGLPPSAGWRIPPRPTAAATGVPFAAALAPAASEPFVGAPDMASLLRG